MTRSVPAKYSPALVARIFDKVLEGATVRQACRGAGMPSPRTFYRWVTGNEEHYKQWQAVKEIKAHAMFDEAVDLARSLIYKGINGEPMEGGRLATQNQIRATQIAVETLKDAAAKLNPAEYGERKAATVMVPIQIVTNMNMGQDGKPAAEEGTSIYEVSVQPPKVIDG